MKVGLAAQICTSLNAISCIWLQNPRKSGFRRYTGKFLSPSCDGTNISAT